MAADAAGDRILLSQSPPPVFPVEAVLRVEEGGEISMFYDPLIAKLCTWGEDRPAAIDKMREALDRFEIDGIGRLTNPVVAG